MMRTTGNFIRGTIAYKKMVYFILALLIGVGVYGLLNINKDEFPTFEIKEGLVVGVYPGATAAEVESQLTKPLEDLLFTFSEVDRTTNSVSQDGICYIYVMLNSPASKKDVVWSKIKLKLASFKQTLPPGVLAVEVMDDFSSVSSVLIAMESSDKGWTEMKEYSDMLCERLREIPSLANAKVYGTQKEEIAVHIDMERIAAYGITPSMLMLDYRTAGMPVLSGSFKTDYANAPIHVAGLLNGEHEVAQRIVYSDPAGNVIRLKDIATIERRYKQPTSFVDYNGRTALVVSVEMRPDNNIVAFGREVDAVLNDFKEELPDSVKISKITDQPKVVGTSVWSFLRDLLISMLVVIFVMLILFPVRSALIASSGVPICTAVAVAVMYLTGINLNTVTLAALIVVLGMIVDDSIITMDGYMDKLGRGMDKTDAACASANELFMPMFLSTSSISLMFFPMTGIITGYLGDFVKMFPWVIAISLTASLLYAVMVVPSLEVRYITSAKSSSDGWFARRQERFFNMLQTGYENLQGICFRHPYMTVAAGVSAIALGLLMFSRLNVQMMPMAERDCFAVEIYAPAGAGLDDTKAISDSLQRILLSDKRVVSVTSFVGTGAPRFHATYAPKVPAPSFAQMIVNTETSKGTEEVLKEYESKYEHYFPDAHIRFKQMDYQGVTPIAVTFKGAPLAQMKPFADSLRMYLSGGMYDVLKWAHSDLDEYIPSVEVLLDSDEAARLGVNKAMLSLSLASMFNGLPIASVWEDVTEVPVVVYADQTGDGMTYDAVGNTLVATAVPGISVPLRQVADIMPGWEPESVPRIGGKESITVYADMKFGRSQPEAMKRIEAFVDSEIRPSLPENIEITYGGLTGTNNHVIPEIFMSFICAVAVLFFFLLFHFKKMSLAILTLVLSTLCLFGAFFGLWIFGLDFGMTAVLGLISLVGIIVRNGIIMFEYAEELRNKGMPVKEAAEEAGRRRMRPIFLTSCTTALGVLPMIISRDALWMPMGVVICFGTMLSIILIVLIMPVSYWLIFKKSGTSGPIGAALCVIACMFFVPFDASAQGHGAVYLTLEQCRNLALENDPGVKNAKIDVAAAGFRKEEALAEYFPKVSLNAFSFYAFDPMLEIGVKDVLGDSDFSNNINNLVNQYAPMFGIDPVYSTLKQGAMVLVSAVQPVFAGGRIVNGNRLAAIGVQAAGLQRDVKIRTALADVEQCFWQVKSLEEKMKTIEGIRTLVDSLHKDVSSACAAGLATKTDLLQVEMKRSELRLAAIKVRNGIRLSKMNLFNSIGVDYNPYSSVDNDELPYVDSIYLVDSDENLKEPSVYYKSEEEIALGRKESQLLDVAVKAKKIEKKMTLGEVLPQVGVGVSYGYSNLIERGRMNGAVFASVKIPVSDWGKYSRKLRRQECGIRQAENDRDYLNAQLVLDVRKAWLDLNACWERLLVAEESRAAAKANADNMASHYGAGLVTLSELLEAQTALRQCADEYIDCTIGYRIALSHYLSMDGRN